MTVEDLQANSWQRLQDIYFKDYTLHFVPLKKIKWQALLTHFTLGNSPELVLFPLLSSCTMVEHGPYQHCLQPVEVLNVVVLKDST